MGREVVEDKILKGLVIISSFISTVLTLLSRALSASTLLPSALMRVAPFRESIAEDRGLVRDVVERDERDETWFGSSQYSR